ncbi:MAG: hypothetical protein JWP36_1579 [Paucimonas sp.]|nr:hypothetical protein [Paucimonas sp.]
MPRAYKSARPATARRESHYNAGMKSTLDLVLPFSLPPAELAGDLMRQLDLPGLATLLARGSFKASPADPYSRLLPHQLWLLNGRSSLASAGLARSAMVALGRAPEEGTWFVLHPSHLHIARDHLVLTDLRQLQLAPAHSRLLFDAAAPLFEEEGKQLVYGSEHLWFMRADDWSGLQTAAPDAAVGHNIDIWMPQGPGERAWRKLHNEVQMLWHTLDLNDERAHRGHKPVNALWCWNAGGDAPGATPSPLEPALAAFLPTGSPHLPAAELPALLDPDAPALAVIDDMAAAALGGDWGAWLEVMQDAERRWFAPLLAALRSGQVERLNLVMTDGARLAQLNCSRMALRKFWIAPSLARLKPALPIQ